MSHFKHFYELTGGNGAQFVAVTDPGSPLEALADEKGFRKVWLADPNIGGRYSVLSYFGLVPAALAGVPLEGLLATGGARPQRSAARARTTPACCSATKLGELSLAGRDKLTFIVDAPIDSFGLWVEQSLPRAPASTAAASCPSRASRSSSLKKCGDVRRRPRVRSHRQQHSPDRRQGRDSPARSSERGQPSSSYRSPVPTISAG